jgi:hypothetical protein
MAFSLEIGRLLFFMGHYVSFLTNRLIGVFNLVLHSPRYSTQCRVP